MKKTILALALLANVAVSASAGTSYLGTDNQDVSITSQNGALNIVSTSTVITAPLPAGTNNIGDVDVLSLPSIPAGTNNIGDVDVLTLPALSAGSNQIGTVSGSTVTSIIKDSGGEEATVTGGRLDVNATFSGTITADVNASTVGIKGSQGTIITSQTKAAGTALLVNNAGRPDLDGLSLVYKSSDSMVVAGAITLTGKANQVDLQALGNDCTFNINGGEAINVAKNTAEAFNFDYHAVNLTVNLTAKTGAAVCKARITGAN